MIGIIGAMKIEIDALSAKMSNATTEKISGVEFVSGNIGSCELVCAVAGIGKVNAAITAQTMILKYKIDALVNIGIAGAVAKGLNIGDIVVADKVVQHDMDTSPLGDELGFISGINKIYIDADKALCEKIINAAHSIGANAQMGTIATGDIFVSSDALKTKLSQNFGAKAAEMEGGAIGHVCYVNSVPFSVLRTLSDSADGNSVEDYPKFASDAALKSIEIITEFLKNYS